MPTRLPDFPLDPRTAVPAALNHLLAPEAGARQRLAEHAGKTVRVVCVPFTLALVILPEGLVARAASGEGAALVIDLPAAALPAFLLGGRAALTRQARLEGDAELAAAVAEVAGRLRWDVEEDLARLVGDAAATQLTGWARASAGQVTQAGGKLAANLAEYLLEEQPHLVRPRTLDALAAGVAAVRDDLARLERRVAALSALSALSAPIPPTPAGRAAPGARPD